MRRPILPFIVAISLLASCSISKTVTPEEVLSVAPTPASVSSASASPASTYYGPKMPGRWGIYVDAGNPPSSYASTTDTCTASRYDIAAGAVIRNAVIKASGVAFDSLRTLASPPGGAGLSNLTGAVLVRVTKAEGNLTWQGAPLPAKSNAKAELAAEVTVINSNGRMLGTFSEKAMAMSDDGPGGCDGGEALVTQAYERASRMLMEKVLPDIATN